MNWRKLLRELARVAPNRAPTQSEIWDAVFGAANRDERERLEGDNEDVRDVLRDASTYPQARPVLSLAWGLDMMLSSSMWIEWVGEGRRGLLVLRSEPSWSAPDFSILAVVLHAYEALPRELAAAAVRTLVPHLDGAYPPREITNHLPDRLDATVVREVFDSIDLRPLDEDPLMLLSDMLDAPAARARLRASVATDDAYEAAIAHLRELQRLDELDDLERTEDVYKFIADTWFASAYATARDTERCRGEVLR